MEASLGLSYSSISSGNRCCGHSVGHYRCRKETLEALTLLDKLVRATAKDTDWLASGSLVGSVCYRCFKSLRNQSELEVLNLYLAYQVIISYFVVME